MKTLHGKEARQRLMKGIDLLADAVQVTLGPKGSTVMIQDLYKGPYLTKDGVTVAKAIDLLDPVEDMGVQLIKSSATKALSNVGDGTTTTTILTRALIKVGMQTIDTTKQAPVTVAKKIGSYLPVIIDKLQAKSLQITEENSELLDHVATISSNNDAKVGGIISGLYKEVGLDGIVKVVMHDKTGIETEISQGSVYENGYLHPSFVNLENSTKVEYANCKVLIVNTKITKRWWTSVMEYALYNPILVICNEIDRESLSLAVQNRLQNSLNLVIVTSPGFGETRKNYLEDIALLTGATIVNDLKIPFNAVLTAGNAGRVLVSQEEFVLVDAARADAVDERVAELKEFKQKNDLNEFDSEIIDKRIASLIGKIALIKVGAFTELEAMELKDRVDDAVAATAAALEAGVLPGGGNALAYVGEELLKEEELTGLSIVELISSNVLEAPRDIILRNAGISRNGRDTLQYFTNTFNKGTDASKSVVVDDLIAAGIVDPTKVTISAIETAFSIATTVLTTDCLIFKDFKGE